MTSGDVKCIHSRSHFHASSYSWGVPCIIFNFFVLGLFLDIPHESKNIPLFSRVNILNTVDKLCHVLRVSRTVRVELRCLGLVVVTSQACSLEGSMASLTGCHCFHMYIIYNVEIAKHVIFKHLASLFMDI